MVVECKGVLCAASRYVSHRAVRQMRNQAVALVARRRHNCVRTGGSALSPPSIDRAAARRKVH